MSSDDLASKLHKAVWVRRDATEVFRILDANEKLLNAVIDPEWGATVLHCAADKGLTKIVRGLLKRKGIEVNTRNNNGCTPFYYACFFEHYDVAELLLQHKADPNIPRVTGDTPLYAVCRNGKADHSVVKLLLEHKATPDPEQSMKSGDTPLFVTCQNGVYKAAEHLLRHKAEPDNARKDGISPLYVATQNGHISLIELLLKHKATPDKPRKDGITPLWIASQFGHLDAIKLLVQHKAAPDTKREEGTTPVYIACEKDNNDIVKYLLELKVSPDTPRQNGATAIISSVMQDRVEIVRMLLEAGADTKAPAPWRNLLKQAKSDKVKAMLKGAATSQERRAKFLAKLVHRPCQRQWARVLAASSGHTTVATNVRKILPGKPLQEFFIDFHGLTAFIGRIVLSYYDNTVGLTE